MAVDKGREGRVEARKVQEEGHQAIGRAARPPIVDDRVRAGR